jgi:hypothetical protein
MKHNFIKILNNITNRIYKKNQALFSIDVEEQRKFLNKFPEPRDLFERSYFQYRCQMKKLITLYVIIQNIAALVLLPVYHIKLTIVQKNIERQAKKNCAVFFTDGIPIQTIPECLSKEYYEIILCNFAEEMYINKYEKKIMYELFLRYWYSPYFLFKCMLKIGMYAAKIEKFSVRAIISYSEYSFTSSVLTEYCHLRRVEHINIMHGEKLFNIRDSFVQYDKYYVWNEYYINLLSDLRVDKEQFRVAIPESVRLDYINNYKPIYDYTYYLGGEKTEELLTIRDTLLRTGSPIKRICIRYHPRYCDPNEIKRIYKDFQIENPIEVPLNISLSKTRLVVSLFSTVLYQAYESGKDIVIDDVTNKLKYKKLKELGYIMLEKPHKKLSEYLHSGQNVIT